MVTGILGVAISPVVLLVSLFKPSMKVGRRWIVSITILAIICAGFAWAAASTVDYWSSNAIRVLGDYSSARLKVRDLPFSQTINYEALRNGLDPCLVAAVISQESGYQPDTVSWRGARGLMQITPATWREFVPNASCKGEHAPPACSGECIYAVAPNIGVGCAYLRYLIDASQGDIITALASYNSSAPAMMHASDSGATAVDGGSKPAPRLASTASEPQGHTRNVIQAWINFRGRVGASRVRMVGVARLARPILSWITLGLLGLMLLWAAIRYPGLGA